ncbi:D-2-hydroxyacid dehydrogenase family protein [Cognatishimia sp. WU-CL00825]|uniref:D-2-hydroxyacid dehydrogenase family protein n=1 Tax=Cognatishimia sp. WU-CL00825 TaxID=3127658 RepID=UPI00310417F3
MKVHILDDWFDTLRHLPCFARLSGHDVTVWTDQVTDEAVLAQRLHEAECLVLFRERTKITRSLLQKLPNLRLISQRSVYPHVDVQACTDQNVLLCSNMHAGTPSFAAAELTWALILAAMRDLPAQMASAKSGHWQMGVGKTLRGRQLGLYGYGRIAKAVANYATAFGMNTVWWSSAEGRARARADGHYVAEDRHAFFSQSDIVSLHVRLKPSTRAIITAQDFAAMKCTSVFINTSRAGLITPGALLTALNAGHPSQAAIDVFDAEPMTDPDDPLLSHPKLLATPHIGFVTEDEFELQFSDIFDQVNAFADKAPIHMINPSIWTG